MTTNPPIDTPAQRPRWRLGLAALLTAAAATAGLAAVPARSAGAAPAPAPAAVTAARTAPDVAGVYTVHFSWGCTAAYAQATVTFNANNTFTDSYGGTGTWALVNGSLFWEYSQGRTGYSGTIDGNVGSGAMSTLIGAGQQTGCWYAAAPGTTGGTRHAAHDSRDPAAFGSR